MRANDDSEKNSAATAQEPSVRLEGFGALRVPIASLDRPLRLRLLQGPCTAGLIREAVCALLPEHAALIKRSALATQTRILAEGEAIDSETLRTVLVLLPPVSGG